MLDHSTVEFLNVTGQKVLTDFALTVLVAVTQEMLILKRLFKCIINSIETTH